MYNSGPQHGLSGYWSGPGQNQPNWNRGPSSFRAPNIKQYFPKDLYPTVTDPACSFGPGCPLAAYWPVYLSNFFVCQWDEAAWYDQISEYFACKGLPTRMMYFHTLDWEFWEMQRQCSTVDALVYFVSESDAWRAIDTCHRDLYYGHRLNVLPGRIPVFFDNGRAALFERYGKAEVPLSETKFENALMPLYAEVVFCSKRREYEFIVEFSERRGMIDAVKAQKDWVPNVIGNDVRKQRFLEKDLETSLQTINNSSDKFLNQKPSPQILRYFFEGVVPNLNTSWMNYSHPKESVFYQWIRDSTVVNPSDGIWDKSAFSQQRFLIVKAINAFLTANNLPLMSVEELQNAAKR